MSSTKLCPPNLIFQKRKFSKFCCDSFFYTQVPGSVFTPQKELNALSSLFSQRESYFSYKSIPKVSRSNWYRILSEIVSRCTHHTPHCFLPWLDYWMQITAVKFIIVEVGNFRTNCFDTEISGVQPRQDERNCFETR